MKPIFKESKFVLLLAGVIAAQRLIELWLAKQNFRWAKTAGAQEFGAGHYPLFFILHIGWLVGWIIESWRRRGQFNRVWPLWLGLFMAAQGLRYWCIISLGRFWNTRILVIPGAPIIRQGPYRWLKHPNYLAVALELVSLPLVFSAWVTALIASGLNAALLLGIRIPAEEKALQLAAQNPPAESLSYVLNLVVDLPRD